MSLLFWRKTTDVSNEASVAVTETAPLPVRAYPGDDDTPQQVTIANSVDVDPITATPTCYNQTLTSADTEYSQAMPANCRRFEFQARTEDAVRFAFVTGKVAASTAPYMSLKAGATYDSGPINQSGSPSTIYLASSIAGVVVEILAWT